MACIRKRRGKHVVDYRDATGRRRWVTCETRRQAENVLGEVLRESRQPTRSAIDTEVTVRDYAGRWLRVIRGSVKPKTLTSYDYLLREHVIPAFGHVKVRLLHRGGVKAFLGDKLGSGLSQNTVRLIHSALRAMLNAAVDDGVIVGNPADRLGRSMRLVASKTARQERIKAFTREQIEIFLAASRTTAAREYPLFLFLARTGARLGEALALQQDDVDVSRREVRIDRSISDGLISSPKSGHGRTVDLSAQLSAELARLHAQNKAAKLRRGWKTLPPWVFPSDAGTPLDHSKVAKAFKRVLKAAGLPPHHSPHSLRHSFASLLLQQGESPAYVQRQLGHASIQLTVDTYGKWLPMGNKAAVDRLDGEPSGSKAVAEGASGILDDTSSCDETSEET